MMCKLLDIIKRKVTGDELPDIRVFDADGNPRDWAWVLAEFGPLDLRLAEPSVQEDGSKQVVRLVEVREQYGPSSIMVNLRNTNGAPVEGIEVAWYWPDAPLLPAIPPPTSVWEPRADHGPTNLNGDIAFAMGTGAYYYWPDRNEAGPHGVWVLAPGHPSDGLFGLGMIAGTDHRHLNLWFQVVVVEDGGEEGGEDLSEVVKQLKRIADALETIAQSRIW